MDIFEYAMKMELDGMKFYLELAEKASDKGVKKIFEMLASDENKHYNTIKDMQLNELAMPDTPILNDAKNVFEQMDTGEGEWEFPESEIDLYKEAMRIEEESRDFYSKKSEEMEDPGQREFLVRLAEEEKKHYFLLNNLLTFVQRPQTWIENAEWNHLDEY